MQRIVQVYITYEDPRKTVGCLRVLLLLLLIRCCFAVVSSIRSSLCPLLNTVLYVSYYYEYDPRFQYVGGRRHSCRRGSWSWPSSSSKVISSSTHFTHFPEIKTQSGRGVVVAASKSLIVWNPTLYALQEKACADLTLGKPNLTFDGQSRSALQIQQGKHVGP